MENRKVCFMYGNGLGGFCGGGLIYDKCPGEKCPFFKTEGQQREIEQRIVKRLKSKTIPIQQDYKSRIDGEVLIPMEGHNRYCAKAGGTK